MVVRPRVVVEEIYEYFVTSNEVARDEGILKILVGHREIVQTQHFIYV